MTQKKVASKPDGAQVPIRSLIVGIVDHVEREE